MSEFPPESVRRAFESSIEAPVWSRAGLGPLAATVRSHLSTEAREGWAALGGIGGADEDRVRDAVGERMAPGGGLAREVSATAFMAACRKDLESFLFLSSFLSRVAFLCPESSIPAYSVLADAWAWGAAASEIIASAALRGEPVEVLDALARLEADEHPLSAGAPALDPVALAALDAEAPALSAPSALPAGFVELFWAMVGEPVDATTITPKIASFGGAWPLARREAEVRAMLKYEAVAQVIDEPFERAFTLESLAEEPEGSLGRGLHDLIVRNGYDFDILEAADSKRRESSSAGVYHPRIDPISRRLLFTHDIFHLVGGYSTSPLQEVGIVGFQLAQFGNGYARDFIPTVLTLTTLTHPMAAWATLQVALEGWCHGRANPPLICVDWNAELGKSIEQIRDELSFEPFESKFPDVALDAI